MPHFPIRSVHNATAHQSQPQSLSLDVLLTPNVQDSAAGSTSATVEPDIERVRAKNRRKRYLDLHPEYFTSLDVEGADPLLYDRLVRRFQTAEEREQEARERGTSGVQEAVLNRSEAKLEALQNPDPASGAVYQQLNDGSIIEVNAEEISKEEAWNEWVDVMTQRFLAGSDDQFDYGPVDEGEDYDDHAEEDWAALERYIDEEDPVFDGMETPRGETGVQDY